MHKSTFKEKEDDNDFLEAMENREISIAEPPLGDCAELKDEEEETPVEKEDEEEVEVAAEGSEPRRKQKVNQQHDIETNICILLVILLSLLTLYQHGYRLNLLSGSRTPVVSFDDVVVHETPGELDILPLTVAPTPETAKAKTLKGLKKSRPLMTDTSEQTKLVKTKTRDKTKKAHAGSKSVENPQEHAGTKSVEDPPAPSPPQTNPEL